MIEEGGAKESGAVLSEQFSSQKVQLTDGSIGSEGNVADGSMEVEIDIAFASDFQLFLRAAQLLIL